MNIAVFCGSASEIDPRILVAGRVLGQALASRRVGLIYGGSSIGLMGAVADACVEAGGEVIGVIPQVLVDAEIAHRNLTRLEVVRDLHRRKARMAELANGFAVLPGGLGTLDEAFDIITWRTLGLHEKPIAFLDTLDFWKPLKALLDHLSETRFVKPHNARMIQFCPTPEAMLDALGAPKS
ncbi:MAG: TIGR00730 family Rossman fold protein [Deltaproteobacteria bacterium]|nr:TIGR00730 family Rossman fold protein [Deltaproteobacteria bacterium]